MRQSLVQNKRSNVLQPYTKKRINEYLKLCRLRSSSRIVSFFCKRFIVFPKVFNPLYAVSSKVLFQNLKTNRGANILDMGCGTGILGINALYQGAGRVVFVDTNLQAIRNTQENIRLHSFQEKTKVIRSNLFQKLGKETFDVILFNSPFVYSEEVVSSDAIKKSIFDYRCRTLNRFFSQAQKYLKPNGYILFVFSNLGNEGKLLSILERNHLRKKLVFYKKRSKETWMVYSIQPDRDRNDKS